MSRVGLTRRTDLLALSNLRNDGRRPGEIRRMRIQMGPLGPGGACSGSALVSMGLTTVLASVRGPTECARRSDELPDRAFLEVTVKTAPFSSAGDRRVTNPQTDRRLQEMSSLVQQVMGAAVLLHLYPKARIELCVTILADDGGRLEAAINASTLALVEAGIPLLDLVCACSAGLDQDVELVDLNHQESFGGPNSGAVYMPCASMVQRGTVVLAQCESRLPLATLERLLNAAMEACRAESIHSLEICAFRASL
eukprot:scaffold27362_cov51-Attheya_sp.AAC.2